MNFLKKMGIYQCAVFGKEYMKMKGTVDEICVFHALLYGKSIYHWQYSLLAKKGLHKLNKEKLAILCS